MLNLTQDVIDCIMQKSIEIKTELETAKTFIKTNFGKNGKIAEIITDEKDLITMLIKIFKTYGVE